jgi:UDP-glucose 4-epimerase
MIANQLNKNIYLVKIPFFRSVLKQLKPEIYKRLYKSLEIDNSNTVDRLGFFQMAKL